MISVSTAFMNKVNNGEVPKYKMQLLEQNGTTHWIADDQFWSNGISFSAGTSGNGIFEVGAAVIGSFDFILNNFDGDFDNIDLNGAVVFPYVYFDINGAEEAHQKGTFYIVSHKTTGRIIRCKALDGLKLFDQSNTAVTYPVSFESLVRLLAAANNVTVADASIPNGTYSITVEPDADLTDRQKLSYACQITGNFAVMNSEGELHIGWYDTENPIVVNSTFDGKDLWTDPITLTGVSVSASYNSTSASTGDVEYLYGTSDNVIYVKDNPYIDITNMQAIATQIGTRILGDTIRPGSLPVLANPCIEAGDVLLITDRITNTQYLFPVTNLTYNRASLTENVSCDFEAREYSDLRPTSEYNVAAIIKKNVKTYYTWVAYADDASGTNISLSNVGKTYIGIASNQLVETPDITDPTVYIWKKYVGNGVASVTYYYQLVAESDPAPSTPTTDTPTGWTTTEPAYVSGSTNVLYTTVKISYSDGTFSYTTPQVSSSYTASKQAYNEARNALTSANGKSKIYYQTTTPTGGTYNAGDTWFDTAHGNLVYEYDGSAWTAQTFGSDAIADLAITNAIIANATIQSAKIASVDAGKITTGELTSILIVGSDNDYWNLSDTSVTYIDPADGTTKTAAASTLQTSHLIAEDDVYVNGGPGSYLKIPTDDTGDSYVEMDNDGMTVKATSETGDDVITTVYPSDTTAVIDILDETDWEWDTESISNVIYAATESGESSDTSYNSLLVDVYDAGGNFVEQTTMSYDRTLVTTYAGHVVQTVGGMRIDNNSSDSVADYVIDSGPYEGYVYKYVGSNNHYKSAANYGSSGLLIAHMENSATRNVEVDAETGAINLTGLVGSSSAAWNVLLNGTLTLNGNNITKIADRYITQGGYEGAVSIRTYESTMSKYVGLGVNASSKILHVYAGSSPSSISYVGRVALT